MQKNVIYVDLFKLLKDGEAPVLFMVHGMTMQKRKQKIKRLEEVLYLIMKLGVLKKKQ